MQVASDRRVGDGGYLPVGPRKVPLVGLYEGGCRMEWRIVGLNFLYAALGVVLMYVSYRAFDLLTRGVDFPAELKRGNIAVAIFIGSLFIAIAIIIGRALN
jgi:hypothetical protein